MDQMQEAFGCLSNVDRLANRTYIRQRQSWLGDYFYVALMNFRIQSNFCERSVLLDLRLAYLLLNENCILHGSEVKSTGEYIFSMHGFKYFYLNT